MISLNRLKPLFIQLSLALLMGLFLNLCHVPVSWLLGGILGGVIYVVLQETSPPFPTSLSTFSQAMIAIATATRFSLESLGIAKHYAVPLMICIVVTGAVSLLNGYLLHRWAGIEKSTGFLGSIPGSSASIVAMSEDMGADAIAVALLQSLRIFLVALIIPLLMRFLFPIQGLTPHESDFTSSGTLPLPLILDLILVTGCCLIGITLGKKLKFPSGIFLAPFGVGLIIFWLLPHTFYVPQPLFIAGLVFLGLSIGLKFKLKTIQKLLKAVIIEFFLVIILILICLGMGYLFHLITGVDPMTAILGSTPGGISAMIATAINLQGDTGLVMTMQMTRMLLILLLTPFFANTLKEAKEFPLIDPSIKIE